MCFHACHAGQGVPAQQRPLCAFAGEFSPLATSARVLRLRRSPQASFRIPGRAPMLATVSDITPQTVVDSYWPQQRTPTRVSGPASKLGTPSSSSMPTGTGHDVVVDAAATASTQAVAEQNGAAPL